MGTTLEEIILDVEAGIKSAKESMKNYKDDFDQLQAFKNKIEKLEFTLIFLKSYL